MTDEKNKAEAAPRTWTIKIGDPPEGYSAGLVAEGPWPRREEYDGIEVIEKSTYDDLKNKFHQTRIIADKRDVDTIAHQRDSYRHQLNEIHIKYDSLKLERDELLENESKLDGALAAKQEIIETLRAEVEELKNLLSRSMI